MSFVSLNIEYFPDPTRGRPVFNGFIYVGEPDTDPTIPGNQKEVVIRQMDGVEIVATQPVRTGAGGVAVYNGSPVQLLVDGGYSLTVLDKLANLVYYVGNATGVTGDLLPGLLLSDLKATDGFFNGATMSTVGRLSLTDHGGGDWVFKAIDLQTEVAADSLSGVYVAPNTDTSGASGAWVRVHGDTISPLWFGAVGDGVNDDVPAIQASIDYALYFSVGLVGKVVLPSGVFKISDTIHLGYGGVYHGITLEGAGMAYAGNARSYGSGPHIGTTIEASGFSDRPAIAVQGGRNTVVSNLAIRGANRSHIVDNLLAHSAEAPLLDDIEGSNWVDPTLHANADSRYAPYAGIALDPYSGVRPAISYPDVVYPSYTGIVSQYSKLSSSNFRMENVGIEGFVVGYVNCPADYDANSDFTSIVHCQIRNCKYLISICNGQSRNVQVSNGTFSNFYIGFTNQTHGRQIGQLGGIIDNCAFGGAILIFDINSSSFAGVVTVTNLYAESSWSLGSIGVFGSSATRSWIFNNITLKLGLQNEHRGSPAYVFSSGIGTFVTFNGGYLGSFWGVAVFNSNINHLIFNGTYIANNQITLTNEYEKYAINATMGGLIQEDFGGAYGVSTPKDMVVKYQPYNVDTGAVGTVAPYGPSFPSSRSYPFPIQANSVFPIYSAGRSFRVAPKSGKINVPAKFSALVVNGLELTATWAVTRPERDNMLLGGLNGDVLVDEATGSVYFIKNTGATYDVDTFVAVLQNNLKPDGAGGFEPRDPIDVTVTSTMTIGNSRHYCPSKFTRGDVSTSSSIINAYAPDGSSVHLESSILVGDYMANYAGDSFLFASNTSKVTARDDIAGTITMGGNGRFNITYEPMNNFIRLPPADV